MTSEISQFRNVAIVAHIDHGKTTLLDSILRQGGVFRTNEAVATRVMDSNDQERERGITIYAKNTAIRYKDAKINFVDTPGHSDFSGEVERVLQMVNGVLLLVDACEGAMPQTRFVLKKTLEARLKPIVVVNKIDRPVTRIAEVQNSLLDLFIELGAEEDQLDFPMVYASALRGFARYAPEDQNDDLNPLFEMILKHIPAPPGEVASPFQMQVATLEYDNYVGKLACGRILNGTVKPGMPVARVWNELGPDWHPTGDIARSQHRVTKVYTFEGLKRVEIEEGVPGDIVLLGGLEDPNIGDTVGNLDLSEPLPFSEIGPPTLSVNFHANNSPFAGREGKYVTMRKIRERLDRELKTNVSLRVEDAEGGESLKVSGRGELHISVLIETMRREGYELAVSRPAVITMRGDAGELLEPIESLVVEVQNEHVGFIIGELATRKGEMLHMGDNGAGLTRLEYLVPTRGLIGLRGMVLNATQGTGMMAHRFETYGAWKGPIPGRSRGVLVSQDNGKTTAYAIGNLQERSVFFVGAGVDVYEGMVVGENCREDDMTVNVVREKKLTNMRASGSDENILLTPPRQLTLEQALGFIGDDELVEVTPGSMRLRKKHLSKSDREIAAKKAKSMAAV
jgi:GTP-binding protein